MKIFLSLLLVLILVLSFVVGVDENAMRLHDEAFERAMIAFGLAKGLNAVISLIQGTQLSFTPVGVGLSFSIGEVLDPFNDMVERFSWVMLAATVSLGIQKIVLILSSKLFLQIAVAISVAISLIFVWKKELYNRAFFILPFKILLLLLVLRFGAITSVYTSEFLYNSVLHVEYVDSSKIIVQTKSELEEMQSRNTQTVNSNKDRAWYKLDMTLNVSKKLDALQESIERASKNIITLITIFIVQSIVMPLLFMWFFISIIKWIFRFKLDLQMKNFLRLSSV
jgi:hypothetical protein